MLPILVHPTYFPSISHYVAIANASTVSFEIQDNYQKQTYRNRMFVYGANGKQLLNIPIDHQKNTDGKLAFKEVQLKNDYHWQSHHWKTLQSAYKTSPFFEFYEDELQPFFQKKHTFLLDVNLESFELINECLQLEVPFSKTETYEKEALHVNDYRSLVHSKKEPDFGFETYTQVFEAKHGFIPNLSIIDLLCNEGPNALNYLEKQQLSL